MKYVSISQFIPRWQKAPDFKDKKLIIERYCRSYLNIDAKDNLYWLKNFNNNYHLFVRAKAVSHLSKKDLKMNLWFLRGIVTGLFAK